MTLTFPALEVGVTKAPGGAVVTLVLIVVAAVLFTVGWRLAVGRRYEAHRWVMTTSVCLNAVVVLAWMIRSLIVNVIPALPEKLGESSYLVATTHALVGMIGLVLGVYVALVGNELLPKSLRFTRFKPVMRIAYALYMLGTVTGVILYVVAYVGF